MKTRHLAGALALLVACSWSPLAAVPLLKGEISRVDGEEGDCQEQVPDVAPFPGGGYVTVWAGGFNPAAPEVTQIYARVTGANGVAIGPEIRVSEHGRQLASPAVAAGTDGRFLVTWTDLETGRVLSRLFTGLGEPVAGETSVSLERFIAAADVAARPGGGYAVLFLGDSAVFLGLVDANGNHVTDLFVEGFFSPIGFNTQVADPQIAVQPDGDFVVAWNVEDLIFNQFSGPQVKVIPADSFSIPGLARWIDLAPQVDFDRWHSAVTVGTDRQGNVVTVWLEHQGDRPGTPPVSLQAQIFDPQGQAIGAPFRADGGTWARLGGPRLLVGADGDFLLAWHGVASSTPAASTAPSSIYVRSFSADGTATGDPVVLAPAAGHSREEPALAWLVGPGGGGNSGGGTGNAIAVWQEGRAGSPVAPQGCFSAGIGARQLSPGCIPGAGRLCLGDGRFQLSANWATPAAAGQGRPQAVTRDTGYFWFFGPENVELMIKVLDGRPVNGKFWVFYGSLSNVAWTLRVADLKTGAEKTYSNPPGQLASHGDTAALPGESTADSASFEIMPFAAPAVTAAAAPLSPVPSPLVLNGERFAVEVLWHDPFNNVSGFGVGRRLTDDSGYFVFFSPENVELVVKVLDGRAVNGKFWVFYGALTNVEYDIRVQQLDTGVEKTYHNPPFQFRSVADTSAF